MTKRPTAPTIKAINKPIHEVEKHFLRGVARDLKAMREETGLPVARVAEELLGWSAPSQLNRYEIQAHHVPIWRYMEAFNTYCGLLPGLRDRHPAGVVLEDGALARFLTIKGGDRLEGKEREVAMDKVMLFDYLLWMDSLVMEKRLAANDPAALLFEHITRLGRPDKEPA